MVAQRGHGVVASEPAEPVSKRASREGAAAKSAPPQRRRLSPTDQHVLKTAPKRIAALTDEIARLERVLADPALYVRDREAFTAASDALSKAQADRAAAEEAWLRVEMLREEIEAERVPAPVR
jgi:ATP-binding cassette subfamily F protein uup